MMKYRKSMPRCGEEFPERLLGGGGCEINKYSQENMGTIDKAGSEHLLILGI